MAELRKVGVLSVMKIAFVINLILGFVAALAMTVFTLVLTPLSGMGGSGMSSLAIGWSPVWRSMIERRACPRAILRSGDNQWPRPSGPRWSSAAIPARTASAETGVPEERTAVMPHIDGLVSVRVKG